MKPGYMTTEFWTTASTIVGALVSKEGSNQALFIICGTVLAGLYIVSRTFVKYKEEKSE